MTKTEMSRVAAVKALRRAHCVTVREASLLLARPTSTIRRWLAKGRLLASDSCLSITTVSSASVRRELRREAREQRS